MTPLLWLVKKRKIMHRPAPRRLSNSKRFLLTFLALIMVCAVRSRVPEALAQTPGTFAPTGFMKLARAQATATLLPNGRVLVAGGQYYNGSQYVTNAAELYNPASGSFQPTGNMTIPRYAHTATLLQNGKVLITGGYDNNGNVRGRAELYDPSAGTFTATGNMILAREEHTATLLPDGEVLIAGGQYYNGSQYVTNTAEIYNPATGAFTSTGSMSVARIAHTATLMANGRVLIAGGFTAEIYDPADGSFATTGALPSGHGNGCAATLLLDGRVLDRRIHERIIRRRRLLAARHDLRSFRRHVRTGDIVRDEEHWIRGRSRLADLDTARQRAGIDGGR